MCFKCCKTKTFSTPGGTVRFPELLLRGLAGQPAAGSPPDPGVSHSSPHPPSPPQSPTLSRASGPLLVRHAVPLPRNTLPRLPLNFASFIRRPEARLPTPRPILPGAIHGLSTGRPPHCLTTALKVPTAPRSPRSPRAPHAAGSQRICPLNRSLLNWRNGQLAPQAHPSVGLCVGWEFLGLAPGGRPRGQPGGADKATSLRRPIGSKVAFISSPVGAKSLNKYFPGVEEQLSSPPEVLETPLGWAGSGRLQEPEEERGLAAAAGGGMGGAVR